MTRWRLLFVEMDRDELLDDLVTVSMLTARLGLSRTQRVHELMRHGRPPLPRPVWVGPRVQLWSWTEVAAWAQTAARDAVTPGDWVSAQVVRDRLRVDVEGLDDHDPEVATTGDPDGQRRYRWGDAERVWIDRANRARR